LQSKNKKRPSLGNFYFKEENDFNTEGIQINRNNRGVNNVSINSQGRVMCVSKNLGIENHIILINSPIPDPLIGFKIGGEKY